jgi:hypothetical protein
MRRISLGALPALLTVALMGFALGCGDDDDNGPVDPVDGGNGAECLDRLSAASPDTPAACQECLCDNCETQLEACDDQPGCQDQVDCAQDAVGDGTCPSEPQEEALACLETECGIVLAEGPASLGLLLCISNNCGAECIPDDNGDVDAGVEDAGAEDAGEEDAGDEVAT